MACFNNVDDHHRIVDCEDDPVVPYPKRIKRLIAAPFERFNMIFWIRFTGECCQLQV